MNFFKFSIILIFLFFVDSINGETSKCDDKVVKAEKLVKKMLFIGEKVDFPKTMPQYNEYCRQAKETLTVTREYRDCLDGFGRQAVSIVINGLKNAFRNICAKKSNKRASLRQIRCYDEKTAQKLYKCIDQFTNRLNFAANNISEARLFPNLCCSLHKLTGCAYNGVMNNCGEGNVDGANFLKKMVEFAFSDVSNLACAKYPSEELCDTKLKEEMEILRKVGELVVEDREKNFVIRPLVKVINRFVD